MITPRLKAAAANVLNVLHGPGCGACARELGEALAEAVATEAHENWPDDKVRTERGEAEAEIAKAKRALLDAARDLVTAEGRLEYLQRKRCPHPKKTTKDGGWQGTATITDCELCGLHHVDD